MLAPGVKYYPQTWITYDGVKGAFLGFWNYKDQEWLGFNTPENAQIYINNFHPDSKARILKVTMEVV